MSRPQFIPPQLATLVDSAPVGSDWVFEIKYDGYRVEAIIEKGLVTLYTRRGNDWTARFQEIAERIARFKVKSAVFDGEIVVLEPSGKSSFSLLQQSLDADRDQDLTYFVFDLLELDGRDLRKSPLSDRRRALEKLLRSERATTKGVVRLGQRLEGNGAVLLKAACSVGLEGIIGKRVEAPYTSGRVPAWVKVKCGQRQEFVVIGFTPPKGSRIGVGSLLLGVHDNGALRYAGRVGSGMADRMLRDLFRTLEQLEQSKTPLPARPAGIPGDARWVKPVLVAEVSFTEWTPDGLLRHPVFQGLREDKPAAEVRRERATMAPSQPKSRRSRPTAGARPAVPDRVETRGTQAKPRSTAAAAHGRAPQHPAAPAQVAGVTITHPDRVVFPELGITKLELAQHFERVAPVMLPHVAGRPLSLVRCPEGSAKQCFFQKHWTGKQPPSIDTVGILQSDGKKHPHVVIHDVEGLATLVQWGVMEIHPWGSRQDDPEKPDRITFDLDPGPGVTWEQIKDATRGLHALLEAIGLESWLKTSGGKGVHVVVPIARRNTWDEVSDFARAVAEHMQAEVPDRFISKSSKAARKGLIFVDWLRNTRGATAVSAWSTRARPSAGVSVPISWKQLDTLESGDQFTLLTIRDKPPRTDPWTTLLASKQVLTRTMLRKLR